MGRHPTNRAACGELFPSPPLPTTGAPPQPPAAPKVAGRDAGAARAAPRPSMPRDGTERALRPGPQPDNALYTAIRPAIRRADTPTATSRRCTRYRTPGGPAGEPSAAIIGSSTPGSRDGTERALRPGPQPDNALYTAIRPAIRRAGTPTATSRRCRRYRAPGGPAGAPAGEPSAGTIGSSSLPGVQGRSEAGAPPHTSAGRLGCARTSPRPRSSAAPTLTAGATVGPSTPGVQGRSPW